VGQLGTAVRRERLLGVIRLSQESEESTSPERQKAHVEAIAQYREAVIVGWAIDMDVSGRYVAPWDRPDLGDWMNNRAEEYDGYASWKMDRITRKPLHFYLLMERCDAAKHIIVTRADGIDTSTSTGRRAAELMAMVGSWEWEEIQGRNLDARANLIKTERFPGGRVPFGYEKYKLEEGNSEGKEPGWYLRHNREQFKVLRNMFRWFVEYGWSYNAVAENLNKTGVDTALVANHKVGKRRKLNKNRWQATTVKKMMQSRTLLGERTYKGKPVHDANGMPVMIGPPIFTPSEWKQLQEALPSREGHSNTVNYGGTWLLNVLHCAICQSKMYCRVGGHGSGNIRRYYRCSENKECGNGSLPLEEVETHIEETILNVIGDKPYRERVVIAASDHTEDLEQAQASLTQLMQNLELAQSKTARKFIGDQIAALDGRIAELEKHPYTPRTVIYEDTGKTWREHWKTLSREDQAALLRKSGIKAYALRWAGPVALPSQQPKWPVATLGDLSYALGDKGDKRGGPCMYHVSLGDEEDLLKAA
jgi:site-specific DNA recombinase